MDELLDVLGYKMKASDMSEVAQKLKQLKEVMGHAQEDGLSHLASETVHYNPFKLSSWLESMISELHHLPNFDSSLPLPSAFDSHRHPLSHRIFQDSSFDDYDLKAIAGKAVLLQLPHELSSLINEVDVNDEAADGDALDRDLHPATGGNVEVEDGTEGTEEAELGLELDELPYCARSVAVFFCAMFFC
ncbi:DELLA protein GAI1 [Camellia lanceoleosa]|uniref:DELLA protein GAI1 n=1 Tax=Camellia lanceoleosa TaxID=1840588 RepID=A0ACC0H556_9ERIC|nr:DELLA protein GAI1 [Camellia lanceoleosa]